MVFLFRLFFVLISFLFLLKDAERQASKNETITTSTAIESLKKSSFDSVDDRSKNMNYIIQILNYKYRCNGLAT